MGCLLRLILALFAFLAAVFIVVVGGAWLVSEFGPQRAARMVEARTGFSPEWERLHVRPLAGRLTLENASLRHSSDFPDSDMIRVERLFVDMEPSSIWGRELRFRQVDLDLSRIAYVIGPDGRSNIEVFMQRWRGESPGESAEPRTPGKGRDYRIDHLRVHVGEVIVQDRRGILGSGIFGGEQRVRVDAVVEAEDVTDLNEVMAPLLTELRRAGVREFGGLFQRVTDQDNWSRLRERSSEGIDAVREGIRSLLDRDNDPD
ncbi:MAG: hypothetical protein JJT96_17180 [Opitutales bacterium]|nr:hypothetical protein [Opitutales bacterium]